MFYFSSRSRSPTTTGATSHGRDPYEAFSLPGRRPAEPAPVVPPRLSPEAANPTPRSLFSDSVLARLNQDQFLSRLWRSATSGSSGDHSSGSRHNGHHSEQRSLFGRRISNEGLPHRRFVAQPFSKTIHLSCFALKRAAGTRRRHPSTRRRSRRRGGRRRAEAPAPLPSPRRPFCSRAT